MKTLFLDIFSGISGDMFLGAMLDLGVDFAQIEREIARLGVEGYHLQETRLRRAGIAGVKFDVHLHDHDGDHDHLHDHEGAHSHSPEPASHGSPHAGQEHDHPHEHTHGHEGHDHHHDDSRDFAEIREIIANSSLSDWVKRKSIAVFHRLAVAEGKIHGHPPEEVHFHEVGGLDSIVDIVGACVALELLGKPRVLASPVVEGTGWVQCAHGRFPIPTPATIEILGARGIGVTQCEETNELVTPTGAALLAEFVERFGPMQSLVASRVGYGLGARENRTRPNVLRAILGETAEVGGSSGNDWETDSIAVLETNLDNITPEILGHVAERAMAIGALDVFHCPVQMKKQRPGVLLTVLCEPSEADRFTEFLLRETTTLGVRRSLLDRRKLRRQFVKVATPWGEVTIKVGLLNGQALHRVPEYESCRQIAERAGLPLKTVYETAAALARSESGGS